MIRSTMTLTQVAAAARKDVGQLLRFVEEKHGDLEHQCPKVGSSAMLRHSGRYTSSKGLEWIYVVVARQGRVTIYPLLWWATTKGTRTMQIDAEGPAACFGEHVMDRYLERYLREGNLFNALREFHLSNYDKASQPCAYKGDRENYTAVIDHGYVAGEYLREDAIVFYRTFYDSVRGRKRFGQLRPAHDWRQLMHTVDFAHVGRRDTPHFAWGRGYPFQAARGRKVA